MMRLLVVVLLSMLVMSVHAGEINLGCDELAGTMVNRLAEEGLLVENDADHQRAESIARSSCMSAQTTAQQQLQENKKDWVKNWLFEESGGKPGNKRLKNLKR